MPRIRDYSTLTSCRSTALAVQIYLQMDRVDLARKEVSHAKAWAEDALLLQMMEAWVDLRVVSLFLAIKGAGYAYLPSERAARNTKRHSISMKSSASPIPSRPLRS